MLRTMFAMTVAGLLFAAVSGTSQAAPIAPLPSGVTQDFRRPHPSVVPASSLLDRPLGPSALRLVGMPCC